MKPAYIVLTAGYPILLRRSPVPRILYRTSKLILYKRHSAPVLSSVAVLLAVKYGVKRTQCMSCDRPASLQLGSPAHPVK